jgi:hypothetical protein
MASKYYRGQELLEISNRELDIQRKPVRALLNRVEIPSEDWLVDFLLVLRSYRRDEKVLGQSQFRQLLNSATAYPEIFNVERENAMDTSKTAAQFSVLERDVWKPLDQFTDDQGDLEDLVVRLEAIRRSSFEEVTRPCIALNVPAGKSKPLELYLDWCISTHQSVLHTLLKFDVYASDDVLGIKSQMVRLNLFNRYRGVMLRRLLDGAYISVCEYATSANFPMSNLDLIEESLSHKVGSRGALNEFMRDLRIISLRSQGFSQKEIATTMEVSREKVRQVYRTYSFTACSGPDLSTDVDETVITEKIVDCIKTSPGISISELSHLVQVSIEQCARCIPSSLKKFVVYLADREAVRLWTDDRILGALQLAANFAYPISAKQYDTFRRDGAFSGPSAVLVNTRFGNWTRACEAAGIESGSRPARDYDRAWTDENLMNILIRYFLDSTTTGTFANFDAWLRVSESAYPSRATFRLRFGNWTAIKETVYSCLLFEKHVGAFRSYCDQVSVGQERSAQRDVEEF